jgi:hypothetical protein
MFRLVAFALALLVVSTGCPREKAPPTPCERRAKVEVRVVDHDSPYMRALFRKVGSEGRDGTPIDPAAIAAGVRAEVDQWTTDKTTSDGIPVENVRKTDYYLLSRDRAALEKYLATVEQPPGDREVRLEYIAAQADRTYTDPAAHWRTYYLVKQPIIDTRAIASVARGTDPNTDRPLVLVTLTPEGRTAFARATKANVANKLATLVDGDVQLAPIINSEIAGGRFQITTYSQADADALMGKLACVTK